MSSALEILLVLAGLVGTPEAEEVVRPGVLAAFEVPEPGSRAAQRILDRLARVEASLVTTKYQHRRVVRPREGYYAWDCSAMVNWILSRAAPRAYEAIDRERPVAVSYVRMIKHAPSRRSRDGWRRLSHIEQVRPGDIFAWKRPPDFPSQSTGHVGFVLSAPRRVPELAGAYKVRIADASSYPHEDDTRDEYGEGGYGTGTILFSTDGNGQATGYGWYGNTEGLIETPIYFGRVTK